MTTNARPHRDVNSLPAVASAILLGTVGVLSFIIQPGEVQGFVEFAHLSDALANQVVGMEMMGVALATIITAVIGERLDWRQLLLGALIVAILGNVASAFTVGQKLFVPARFVAGLGHGVIISLSFTFVGLTKHPDRNIALYLVALLTYGAFGLWILPSLLSHLGFVFLFGFFAVATAIGLLTIPFVPASSEGREHLSPTAIAFDIRLAVLALGGVLAYNLAQGIAWANLGLIGTALGLKDQVVADNLFVSQVFAVVGAVLSVVLAGRLKRSWLIAVGILGGAGFIALLGQPTAAALFLISVCGFNFLWNFVLPFILGAVGDLDLHGRIMGPAIALQMTGLGLGPILSSLLITSKGYGQVEAACVGCFLLSLVLLALPIAIHNVRLARQSAL